MKCKSTDKLLRIPMYLYLGIYMCPHKYAFVCTRVHYEHRTSDNLIDQFQSSYRV